MSRDNQPNKEEEERGPHPGEPLFPARHNYMAGRKQAAIVSDATEPLPAREKGNFLAQRTPRPQRTFVADLASLARNPIRLPLQRARSCVEKGLGVMFPFHFRRGYCGHVALS